MKFLLFGLDHFFYPSPLRNAMPVSMPLTHTVTLISSKKKKTAIIITTQLQFLSVD